MVKVIALFFCLGSLLFAGSNKEITRVSFGSCYRTTSKNAHKVWKAIQSTRPELFLFMGDNIYADTEDILKMRKKYRRLNASAGYRDLRSQCKVMATWDDHDYGANDAGENYPKRAESQKEFQDAFKIPRDHISRKTPGVYYSAMFGPKGKRLQVIMLDTRYFRSDIIKSRLKGQKYYYKKTNDPRATILGEAQWRWLKDELKKPADLRIIVSSIQVISSEHRFEKWENFPLERQKLIDLLKETKTKRVVLLSGDRHMAEMSRLSPKETGLSYELLDVTSSGMTHAFGPHQDHAHYINGTYVRENNFGTLEIEWKENAAPVVKIAIRDLKAKKRVEYQANLAH